MSIFKNNLKRPSTIQEQIFELYAAIKELEKMQVVPKFMGTWNSSTNYNDKYMIVSYLTSSYIRTGNGDCINYAPDINKAYWQPLAEGLQGNMGIGIESIESTGTTQEDGNTVTHIKVTLTNRAEEYFDVTAIDGIDGTDGVDIIDITAGTSHQNNGFTVTPITVPLSNGQTKTFNVEAKNGDNGVPEIYWHDYFDLNLTSGALSEELSTLLQTTPAYTILYNTDRYFYTKQAESGYALLVCVQNSTIKTLTLNFDNSNWNITTITVPAPPAPVKTLKSARWSGGMIAGTVINASFQNETAGKTIDDIKFVDVVVYKNGTNDGYLLTHIPIASYFSSSAAEAFRNINTTFEAAKVSLDFNTSNGLTVTLQDGIAGYTSTDVIVYYLD